MIYKLFGPKVAALTILASIGYISLAFLPAPLHQDWMPNVEGLLIVAGLGVVVLFFWARWRLTWGRIGRR